MTPPCIVIGGGGHAKVVVATLRLLSRTVLMVYDDNPRTWGTTVYGVPVHGPVDRAHEDHSVHGLLGIGRNDVRAHLSSRLDGLVWTSAVHPRAWMDDTAHMEPGTIVMAGAIIQPGAQLGRHVIINTGATVDHDCAIGAYCHVAPGAHLAGHVELGEGVFVGAGASIVPGVRVGAWSTIGAGAAVISDVPAHTTVVGVPARPTTVRP